jgi:hypothetical protein
MKNIHILPTDKPSRLVLSNNSILTIIEESNYNFSHIKSVHIYITSDEEIKLDWYLDTTVNMLFKNDKIFLNGFGYKKIILTTDPDLIKDGVQAIDDEFLEWFVNNPSCEEVEVERVVVYDDNNYGNGEIFHSNKKFEYKIIILKEQQKQHLIDMMKADEELGLYDETLEEAAERIAENFKNVDFKAGVIYGVIEGAKWQAERMFSEEEVAKLLDLLERSIKEINHIKFTYKDRGHCDKYLFDCENIIKQFKKK